jgi:hypothetical protein
MGTHHLCKVRANVNHPQTIGSFGRLLFPIPHSPLNSDSAVLSINIFRVQPCRFANTHPGFGQQREQHSIRASNHERTSYRESEVSQEDASQLRQRTAHDAGRAEGMRAARGTQSHIV